MAKREAPQLITIVNDLAEEGKWSVVEDIPTHRKLH